MTNGAVKLALKLVLSDGVLDYSFGSTAYKNGGFVTTATKELLPLGDVTPDNIIAFLDQQVKPYSGCTAFSSIKAINLNNHNLTDKHIAVLKHILDNYTTMTPQHIMLVGNSFTPEGQAEITKYLANKPTPIEVTFTLEGGARYRRRRRTQKVKRRHHRRRRTVR